MLETLISTLVPFVVTEAEKLLGSSSNSESHAWVNSMVDDIFKLIGDKYIPGWLQPEEAALKQMIEDALSKVLDKV
jgi:hypothetical protein